MPANKAGDNGIPKTIPLHPMIEPCPSALHERIAAAVQNAGGWLPFDAYMHMALYEPALGYYAGEHPKFGAWAAQGGDFTTAPELSPLFAREATPLMSPQVFLLMVTHLVSSSALRCSSS